MKKIKILVFSISILFVLMLASTAEAAYPVSENDSSDYSKAEKSGALWTYYDDTQSTDTGVSSVKGNNGWPWSIRTCTMDMAMRFQAQESGEIYFGADWSMSFKIETNAPSGSAATLSIYYVLLDSNFNELEDERMYHQTSMSSGSYHYTRGTPSMTDSTSAHFDYDLQDGSYYYVSVQLYITLFWEANAWSYTGSGTSLSLDVGELKVWS